MTGARVGGYEGINNKRGGFVIITSHSAIANGIIVLFFQETTLVLIHSSIISV